MMESVVVVFKVLFNSLVVMRRPFQDQRQTTMDDADDDFLRVLLGGCCCCIVEALEIYVAEELDQSFRMVVQQHAARRTGG